MNSPTLFSFGDDSKTFSAICDALRCEGVSPAWPDSFGVATRRYFQQKNEPFVKTLSLFSGAGGLDVGFADVGFDIVESVEIEEAFCKTLRKNRDRRNSTHTRISCVDVKNFSGDNLEVDFIIGGPPCQSFSAAGRRANGVSGLTDARGELFREYVRLLKILKPKGFLFENVYGITGAQNGEAWEEIRRSFSEVGYRLFYRVLDAADYGVPQHRERLIVVGLREGEFRFPRPTHGPDSVDNQPFYNAETAIEGVVSLESPESTRVTGRFASLLPDIPPGLNYSFYTEEMGHPHPVFSWRSKFSDLLYKADPNTPVRTIKASGGAYTGPLHWENRFFTCEEHKRLQTFPDDYEIVGSKAVVLRQIGNSVPPQLARILALAIQDQVFEAEFPFEIAYLEEGEKLGFRSRKRELTEIYRRKALLAIESLKTHKTARPESRLYHCRATSNFGFEKTDFHNAQYEVNVDWSEFLTINISDVKASNNKELLQIEIIPKQKIQGFNVKKAILNVYSAKIGAFTVAWKAFENELVENSIKADLIQLNGYYQYPARLACRCACGADFPHRKIVESIVSGQNVALIVQEETLQKDWDLEQEKVLDVALFLRKLGYEIRNHKTNPQIEPRSWLIPYAFPTLTQRSVQLRKQLL